MLAFFLAPFLALFSLTLAAPTQGNTDLVLNKRAENLSSVFSDFEGIVKILISDVELIAPVLAKGVLSDIETVAKTIENDTWSLGNWTIHQITKFQLSDIITFFEIVATDIKGVITTILNDITSLLSTVKTSISVVSLQLGNTDLDNAVKQVVTLISDSLTTISQFLTTAQSIFTAFSGILSLI